MAFICPVNIEDIFRVQGKDALKDYLKIQDKNIRWKVYNCGNLLKFLYAVCPKCKAKLRYQKEGQYYSLKYYMNQHEHAKEKLDSRNAIQSFIESFPQYLQKSQIQRICKIRFPTINEAKFHRIYKNTKQPDYNFQQLLKILKNQNYKISLSGAENQNTQFPEYLLIVSEQMKQAYHKYGKFFTFDMIYDVIKPTAKKESSDYRVGVFVGVSAKKKQVPYGYVIMSNQKPNILKSIFDQFMEIMDNRSPTIITGQQRNIISALSELKKQNRYWGEHIFNVSHLCQLINRETRNQKLYKFFLNLCQIPEKSIFEQEKLKLYEFKWDEIQLVQNLLNQKDRFCVSFMKPLFLGLGVPTSSPPESIEYKIKRQSRGKKTYIDMVLFLNQIFNKLIKQDELEIKEYEKVDLKELIKYSALKQIRFSVHKDIFKKVFDSFVKSLCENFIEVTEDSFTVSEEDNIVEFKVKKYLDADFWACQCQIYEKLGYPCSHLAKVIIKNNLIVRDYTNQYWFIN